MLQFPLRVICLIFINWLCAVTNLLITARITIMMHQLRRPFSVNTSEYYRLIDVGHNFTK